MQVREMRPPCDRSC